MPGHTENQPALSVHQEFLVTAIYHFQGTKYVLLRVDIHTDFDYSFHCDLLVVALHQRVSAAGGLQILSLQSLPVLMQPEVTSYYLTQKQIAQQLGVAPSTVYLTVKCYAESSSIDEVLIFRHNPASDDAKRKIDGREEAKLIRMACTKPPGSAGRWTVRSLTEASAGILKQPVSRATVHRVLKNNRIQPHKSEYYCLPPDEETDPDIRRQFTERMEDVLNVYERPYDPYHPVWCMNEKSLQLLEEVRKPLPAAPGRPRRVDGEYRRNGTAVLIVYVEPLTGKTYVSTRRHRTAEDWAETVYHLLTVICPEAQKVTLVLDNLNIHTAVSLYKRFPPGQQRRLQPVWNL